MLLATIILPAHDNITHIVPIVLLFIGLYTPALIITSYIMMCYYCNNIKTKTFSKTLVRLLPFATSRDTPCVWNPSNKANTNSCWGHRHEHQGLDTTRHKEITQILTVCAHCNNPCVLALIMTVPTLRSMYAWVVDNLQNALKQADCTCNQASDKRKMRKRERTFETLLLCMWLYMSKEVYHETRVE